MSGVSARRRVPGLVLKLAVSVALLVYLANRLDVELIAHEIASARRAGLVLAGAVFFVSNLLGAVQWRTLLGAAGVRLSRSRTLAYYLQGLFFGLFLPANVGGDVSRVVDTTRHTGEFGGAVAATVMDRLVGFYSMGSMAVLALILGGGGAPWVITVPIVGFAGVNLAVALALFSRRASGLLERLVNLIPAERVRRTGVGLVRALHALGRRPGLLLGVFAISVVVQVLRITVHLLVARSMGIELAAGEFFVIIPVLAVLLALPISVGGIGVRESAAVELFGHVGVAGAPAVGMQVTVFLLQILVTLPGWGIFVARQLRGRRAHGPSPEASA
jgi:hypothetical protein